jgi:hypothetical protein
MARHAWRPLLPILFFAAASAAPAAPSSVLGPRLRALDPQARRLVEDALERSATIRQMAGRIEMSDLIVYVRLQFVRADLAGSTKLLSSSAGTRFILVTVNPMAARLDLVPRLGHELQHVLEIADAPAVTDADSMRSLFARIGYRSPGPDSWETEAAIAAGQRVYLDVWGHPSEPTRMVRSR